MKKAIFLFIVLTISLQLHAQRQLRGKVFDKDNLPIPGATIQESNNPANGAISGVDGSFTFSLIDELSKVKISFIGFETKEITPGGDFVSIELTEDVTALNEVEILGFPSVAGRARIRVKEIQRLPETTVALTSEDMSKIGIRNLQDFTQVVSNVTFNQAQQPGVNFMSVRGISQVRNGESPVAVVIDGMTLPDATIMNMSLYDIEMMELVKGPQGTLYGKNAISGAVNIVTKEPGNDLKTKLTLSGGNGGYASGLINSSGAIVKDKLFFSASGRYKNFDGLIENTTLNKKVDYSQEYNFRGKIKWDPTSSLSLTFIQDNFDVKGGASYYVTVPDIFNPVNGPLEADDYSTDPNGDVEGTSELSNSLSSLKVEYFKTKFRLQSVTSFNSTRRFLHGENDYSQYAFSFVDQTSNSDTFSQEFRLMSLGDSRLSYTFGTLFQNSDRYLNTSTHLNNTYYVGTPEFPAFTNASAQDASYDVSGLTGTDDDNTIRTLAAFAFLDFQLTKKIIVSAGLRYDYDKLINDSRISDTERLESNISAWQPKFSISYEPQDNVLIYANYGRGYRSGGFNAEATVKFDKAYDPEFTDNFELGVKSSFWNNRIIFNNSVYRINFENQQQYTFIPLASALLGIYNFEKTILQGFESELRVKASRNIELTSAFGLNDGKIEKGTYNELTNATAFDYESSQELDVSGNASPFTTRTTFSIGANWTLINTETKNINLNVSLDSRGKLYWDALETHVQDPYSLLNSKLSATFGKIGINLWARNILNTEFNQEFFPTAEFGFNNLRFPNRPRSMGLDISVQF